MLADGDPCPRDEATAFVDRAQRLRARGLRETLAVSTKDSFVGLVVLARETSTPDRAELGYWIGRPYRGRGYATAAVAQVLTRGFARMRPDVVFARCDAGNRASTRVLEKLAFSFVGLEAAPDRARARLCRYELTRAEWHRHLTRSDDSPYFFADS